MNSLRHREDEEDLDEIHEPRDREITLGTSMILGIFFALAVLCAIFFAFGYSVGRKSSAPTASSVPAPITNGASVSGAKPGAGSPLTTSSEPAAAAPTVTIPVPVASPDEPNSSETHLPAPSNPSPATESPAPQPAAPIPAPAPVTTSASPAAGPGSVVQIAAVSHQEDADLLVSTLKSRGYNVAIHNEPQDKLLHVQIGPFATHKEADAMRQRLLADGFNAIVKDQK